MALQNELTKGWGSTVKASLRLIGFFSLIAVSVPIHFLVKLVFRSQKMNTPMLFHRVLCRLVGLKVRLHGHTEVLTKTPDGPNFFVCNHSSYLDIPVLGSVLPGCFVAKSEVASWPLIGWMARLQNTVFIERRAVRAGQQRDGLHAELEKGNSLVLFPEGTSSDGQRTLPFKSSLFSIVEKPLESGKPVTIWPVSIICTEIAGMPIGRAWRPYYAWYGDMTLVGHVWDVFKVGSFTIDVIFHAPVAFEDFGDRKLLTDHCHRVIADGVEQCITGRFKA